jgi:hypothetical protein
VVERFAQLLRYIDVRLAHHLDDQRIEPLGIGAPNERCKAALICEPRRVAGTRKQDA